MSTQGAAWAVVRLDADSGIRVVGVYGSYDDAREAQNLQLGWREQVLVTEYHTPAAARVSEEHPEP